MAACPQVLIVRCNAKIDLDKDDSGGGKVDVNKKMEAALGLGWLDLIVGAGLLEWRVHQCTMNMDQ